MSSTHASLHQPVQQARPQAVPLPKPSVAGESFKHSETTRLLCASAYLDRQFRELVIKFCLHDKHHALGACFGLDMATVVRHCRRAQRIFDRRSLFLLLPGIAGLFVVGALLVSEQSSSPADALTGVIGIGLVVFLASFGVCLYFELLARSIVTKHFLHSNFSPDVFLQKDDTPVDELKAAEAGNTVVYSGFTPFVGSGENLGAWSFALDLRKRTCDGAASLQGDSAPELTEQELEDISLQALYECIAKRIAKLGLDRVTIQDKLYVNGRDIRDDKRFLSDPLSRPRYRVEEPVMVNAMLQQGENQLRHYRCIRVVDWNGELVLSIFLRFSRLSHNLFVEASYYLLTPVADRFRAVDAMSPHFRFGRFLNSVLLAGIKTPLLTLWAPISLLNHLLQRFHRYSERKREEELIRENPTFDYGASFSFRQWATANEYRQYFQRLDKEMYMKVLEKNVLDTILSFLKEHDVDVSEFNQRQSMILNQGVMVSGSGTIASENLSVGKGATVQNVTNKIGQAAARIVAPQHPS
jgi:hypothetical protein